MANRFHFLCLLQERVAFHSTVLRKTLKPPWAQWESTWWLIRTMCHKNKTDNYAFFFFFFFCQCGFHYIISCSQIKITVPFLPWNVLPSYLHGVFSYVLKFTQTTLPTRPLLVSQSKFPRPFPFKTFHILSVLFIFSALALTTISYLFCLPVSSIRT